MGSLKKIIFIMVLAMLLTPFKSPVYAVETGIACASKSISGFGMFSSLKNDDFEAFYKKAEKKKRMAKAHRKSLLRNVKRSKVL